MSSLSATRTAAAPYALLGISRLDRFGSADVFGALFADSLCDADELTAEMASAGGVDLTRLDPVDVRDAQKAAAMPRGRREKFLARAQKAVSL